MIQVEYSATGAVARNKGHRVSEAPIDTGPEGSASEDEGIEGYRKGKRGFLSNSCCTAISSEGLAEASV